MNAASTVRRRRDGQTLPVSTGPSYVLPGLWPLCVPMTAIDPDPNNANRHPASQIEELRLTLRTYRQHKPLVVQPKDGRLICRIGNGTLEAARLEGWDQIAVVRADADSDVMSAARAIRDNTAGWGSTFDDAELRRQLREIDAEDPLLAAGLGWDADGLEDLLAEFGSTPNAPEGEDDEEEDDEEEDDEEEEEDDEEEDFSSLGGGSPSNRPPGSGKMGNAASFAHLSQSVEWYTPEEIIEAARQVMGSIDLDPASCVEANTVVRATMFYDEAADGFDRDWDGNVWLNPPYGKIGGKSVAALWAHRLIEQYEDGVTGQACLLVNSVTGYRWFRRLWDYPICFFYNRIAFRSGEGTPGGQAPQSNVVVYLGDRVDEFTRNFGQFGRVVIPDGAASRSFR